MQQSMFSSEEPRANHSASPDFAKAWLTLEGTSHSHILQSLNAIGPSGWYGKTSPASCQRTEDGRLEPLSGAWSNSGIARPGECLTLSTCEHAAFPTLSHSAAVVCSLSHILETGDVPRRFYLTPKACAGILRRAEKRGKKLPIALHRALAQVAGDLSEPEKPGDKTR